MRKVESLQDDMNGTTTYDLGNGKWVTLDLREVRECGLVEVMKAHGVEIPTGRLPVYQRGKEIGTLPEVFEPAAIKSTSYFYDVRPGDFKREGDRWVASPTLGPGDLESVPEFRRS